MHPFVVSNFLGAYHSRCESITPLLRFFCQAFFLVKKSGPRYFAFFAKLFLVKKSGRFDDAHAGPFAGGVAPDEEDAEEKDFDIQSDPEGPPWGTDFEKDQTWYSETANTDTGHGIHIKLSITGAAQGVADADIDTIDQ